MSTWSRQGNQRTCERCCQLLALAERSIFFSHKRSFKAQVTQAHYLCHVEQSQPKASITNVGQKCISPGLYNLEKVLNFTSRLGRSLNSVKVVKKYLISLLGLEKSLKFTGNS